MRLAYVTETYPPELNGVSLTVARTVEWLRQRGHAVQLVRPRQPDEGLRDDAAQWRTGGAPLPLYPGLRFGLARPAALRQRWREAPPDHVHVATPGPLAWAALQAARQMGLSTSADFRTHFHRYSHSYHLGWLERPLLAWLRHLHGLADLTFVPTHELADGLRQQAFGRLQVVGRGVDTDRFAPAHRLDSLRRQWGAGPDDPVSILVGRLAAEKNIGLALRAHAAQRAQVPGAKLVLVGDGPLRQRLQRNHPDVVFAGERHGAELAAHYASADVFLFPSLTDTFGNVTLEALASGLLVVAFDTAAAREHLHDTDLLALPGSDAAFVRAAVEAASLHAHEPALAAALRQRSRCTALPLQWPRVLAQFERHLQRLAETHGAPARQPVALA